MRKSLYSLMLDDGVVAAIDRLAYLENTTRSGLVNRILAEYASYTTPEQRIREAFGSIRALLDTEESLRLVTEPSETLLSLRSALLYKYNPTVRYSVELYRTESGDIGELRVSLRTQNVALLAAMDRFFRLWNEVEGQYIPACRAAIEGGKYLRVLSPRAKRPNAAPALSPTDVGALITRYIRTFDRALKLYFEDPENTRRAVAAIDESYLAYVHASEVLI